MIDVPRTDEQPEHVRRMIEAIAKSRCYATFFEWPNQQLEEWGVGQWFLKAADSTLGGPFSPLHIRAVGEDPPDCEVTNSQGDRIGLEFTELVDESAIRRHRKRPTSAWASWDEAKLTAAIARCLTRKNAPDRVKGGPYDLFVLVLYTDEPDLRSKRVSELLARTLFVRRAPIDRAFLLTSYEPCYRGCRIQELCWKHDDGGGLIDNVDAV